MNEQEVLRQRAGNIRRNIIEAGYHSGSSAHYGSCLSLVEILTSLYFKVANITPNAERDRIILSKGHGALALYSTLYEKGLISKTDLFSFVTNGSSFIAHAHRDISKGIEFSGGSLGLGISFGMGVAHACKLKRINNRVYIIVGDGELDEGLVWESLMFGNHRSLKNTTIIVDCNGLQIDGKTDDVMKLTPLKEKFESFGYQTTEIDGHNINQLCEALYQSSLSGPCAIIANTVKGKGVSFMEDNAKWHYKSLSSSKYKKAIQELLENE